jgi:2-(3-amino-3-carboxypropyl)histidine synthase
MKEKTLEDLRENYLIDFEKIISEIKKQKAKIVLLQFPDGLKPYATTIVDYLDEIFKNKVEFLIWLESCYGACDTPVLSRELDSEQCSGLIRPSMAKREKKIDLIIQIGHNSLQPKI